MSGDDENVAQLDNRPQKHTRTSSPSPPSSPDAVEGSDAKSSRKREREVSLEPSTPKAAIEDDDETCCGDKQESRTPAKKNRVQLESTAEEADDAGSQGRRTTHSHSPPLSTSPPHDIKVRQISQGVEDITWRNKLKEAAEKGIEGDLDAFTGTDQDEDDIVPELGMEPSHTKIEHVGVDTSQVSTMDLKSDETPSTSTGTSNGPSPLPRSRRQSESDSAEQEKGLKRKLGDRATSQGPDVEIKPAGLEPQKRLRDDADKDDNSREKQLPSPPPELSQPEKASISTPAPKLGGFMAYASTSSPFASVKGQNIFSSNKPSPSPSPFSAKPPPSSPFSPSPFSSGESSSTSFPMEISQSPASTATKRTGFEAFASPASPFASVARSKSPTSLGAGLHRSKSPTRRANPANANAFSSYATGGVHGFAVPASKRARAGSPSGGSSRSSLERTPAPSALGGGTDATANGRGDEDSEVDDRQVSFGEKLRAGRDEDEEGKSDEEDAKVTLTEQEVQTGEEEEDTIHQVRGKLFSLSSQNQWKERGTGTLKLNVRRSDGAGARLVMRKEAVYTLLLNVTLFNGMKCFLAQDPRYIRFSVIEGGITTHYNLRVSNAKIAQDLLEEINANIPSA